MFETFVTFGQNHKHTVNGKVLDNNCVAILKTNTQEAGRELAFELFGREFSFEYPEDKWDDSSMRYFPRGYIRVN